MKDNKPSFSVKALAASLLAMAGIGPRRITARPSITRYVPPESDQAKDRYVNRPPLPMAQGYGTRPIIPVEKLRFSSDQRKRRKLNRQRYSRGFKYRH